MDYSNKDYNQLLSDLMSNASKLSAAYDPTSNDLGTMLIKTMANLGDKLNYNIDKAESKLDLYNNDSNITPNLLKLLGYTMQSYIPAYGELTIKNITTGNIELSKYTFFTTTSGKDLLLLDDYTIASQAQATVKVYNVYKKSFTNIVKQSLSVDLDQYIIPDSEQIYLEKLRVYTTISDSLELLHNIDDDDTDTVNNYTIVKVDSNYAIIVSSNIAVTNIECVFVESSNLSASDISNGLFRSDITGISISGLTILSTSIINAGYIEAETNEEAMRSYNKVLARGTLLNNEDYVNSLEDDKIAGTVIDTGNKIITTLPSTASFSLSANHLELNGITDNFVILNNDKIKELVDDTKYINTVIDTNYMFFVQNWYLDGEIKMNQPYTEGQQSTLYNNIITALSEVYRPTNCGFGKAVKLEDIKTIIAALDSNIVSQDYKIKYEIRSPRSTSTDASITALNTNYSNGTITYTEYVAEMIDLLDGNCDDYIYDIFNKLIVTASYSYDDIKHWSKYYRYIEVDDTATGVGAINFDGDVLTSGFVDTNIATETSAQLPTATDKINPCDFLAKGHPYKDITIQKFIGIKYYLTGDTNSYELATQRLSII